MKFWIFYWYLSYKYERKNLIGSNTKMFSITSKKIITVFSVVITSIRTFTSLCRTCCFVLLMYNLIVFFSRNIHQVIGIASTVNKLEMVTNQMNSCTNLHSPRALNDVTDYLFSNLSKTKFSVLCIWNTIKIFPYFKNHVGSISSMPQLLFKYRNEIYLSVHKLF